MTASLARRLWATLPALFGLLTLAGSPAIASAGDAAARVEIVKVHGQVDPALAGYVRGTIEAAERSGSTIILQIDSKGSYGDEAEQLGRVIRSATVPVIAWVGPIGARVEGGALFLVYSSSLTAMAPGAGIGPARPYDLATKASREPHALVARESAALEALAPGAGAKPTGVVRLIDGAALPAGPALANGAVSIVAVDIPGLLRQLDGRSVRTVIGPATLATLGTVARPVDVSFHEMGPLRRVLHAVSKPVAVYILLLFALWGIAFEFTQPGIGLAGIGGVVSLGLACYGLTVVPVHWVGIALVLVGSGLQALDVVVKRLGVLTAAGTAMFAVGSTVAWLNVAPAVRLPMWLIVLATAAGFVIFGFGMTVALKARERVRSAQLGLVGLIGEARSDIDPEGGVFVKGALWRARSSNGKIPAGTRVRVRGLDGLILRVEAEFPGELDQPGA